MCPARFLAVGQFDVIEALPRDYKPGPAGYRVDRSGTPVCVHPFRIAIPEGRYATSGQTVSANAPRPKPGWVALTLPAAADGEDGLAAWLIATLRTADPDELPAVIEQAEQAALTRFAPGVVRDVLRRVLGRELV